MNSLSPCQRGKMMFPYLHLPYVARLQLSLQTLLSQWVCFYFPVFSHTFRHRCTWSVTYEQSPQIKISGRLACLWVVGMGSIPGVYFCFIFPLCAPRKTLKTKLIYSVMDKVDILRCQQIHDVLKLQNTTTSTAPSTSFLHWLATRPHT